MLSSVKSISRNKFTVLKHYVGQQAFTILIRCNTSRCIAHKRMSIIKYHVHLLHDLVPLWYYWKDTLWTNILPSSPTLPETTSTNIHMCSVLMRVPWDDVMSQCGTPCTCLSRSENIFRTPVSQLVQNVKIIVDSLVTSPTHILYLPLEILNY